MSNEGFYDYNGYKGREEKDIYIINRYLFFSK